MSENVPFQPYLPATLIAGDQVLSTGRAILVEGERRGLFWPDSEIRQDIPYHGVHLKLSDRSDAIAISNWQRCYAESRPIHYHFQLA